MYKTLSSQTVFTHSRLTVVEDQVELREGETGDYLWFAGRRHGVTIIARRPDGKILVQQEYSYLPGERLYQLPGGGVDADEPPEVAANRELMEEAGLFANRLTLLGSYLIDHRRSLSRMYLFLGEDLVERQATSRDRYEVDLSMEWLTETEIEALIQRGDVLNVHMLASWTRYRLRLTD